MINKKNIVCFALLLIAAGCNPFSTPPAAGVLRSTNGGVDWQAANTLKTGTGSILQLNISKLDFDPSNRQNVFAGTYNGGMYESQDSASTWTNILSKIYIYDFAISPGDPKTIYAAGLYADHGKVLKTTDGGASWNQIYNEESVNNPVRGIALNPFNPNQIVIGLASGNVIKSADSGNTWQLANNFKDQVNRVLWQGNTIYVLLKSKGLFESTDFGTSFKDATAALDKAGPADSFSNSPKGIGVFLQAYVDTQSPNLIYITTDKGLYKTVDGNTWSLLTLPVNPAAGGARSIAVSKTNSSTVYTTVGATVYKSLDGGNTWQTQGISTGGFVNYILVDPQLPQIVYIGVYTAAQQ